MSEKTGTPATWPKRKIAAPASGASVANFHVAPGTPKAAISPPRELATNTGREALALLGQESAQGRGAGKVVDITTRLLTIAVVVQFVKRSSIRLIDEANIWTPQLLRG